MTRAEGMRVVAARIPVRIDDPLVAALQAGEPAAFERLVREQGAAMLALARRLMRNEEDARDVVQEAFVRTLRAIRDFHGSSRLSTWIHRIVVNTALMKLRSRRRHPTGSIEDLLPRFRDDGHPSRPCTDWSDGCELLEQEERREIVRSCIERLPDSYRTVLLLRDIEEMETVEVARMLCITPNATKIRLHRARQALRALLEPHFVRSASS